MDGPLEILKVPYLFLPGGCVDRVHALRQITAVFHSGVAAGVDAVGHVAGAVADAPLAAVDRRGCDDAGGADGCNLLTGLLTGLRSNCSCLGCLDLSLGCLLVRGCNRCGPGGGHGGNGG